MSKVAKFLSNFFWTPCSYAYNKNLGADAETLAVAKKTSEVNIHRNAQYSAELALDKASQLIVAGRDISPAESIQAINDVSAEDVKRAAAQMLSSKLNVSSFGGVRHVPWAEELK